MYKDGLVRFATLKYTEPTNGNVVSNLDIMSIKLHFIIELS